MKKISFFEGEIYPAPELCNSTHAQYEVEVSDEEFVNITKTFSDYDRYRILLLKRKKKIKR